MRRLTLHIGSAKTGTTYLQAFLRLNAPELVAAGINYATFIQSPNQGEFALPFTSRITRRHLGANIKDSGDQSEYLTQLDKQFKKHIADGHWLISSELLSGRVKTPESIAILKQFVDSHFDQVDVLLYLRRQDFMVPSSYSTKVRAGFRQPIWGEQVWFGRNRSELDSTTDSMQGRRWRMHYNVWVNYWRDAFGADQVQVRPYLERWKSDPDAVLQDFLSALGINHARNWNLPPASENSSASAEALAILRLTTPYVPGEIDGKSNIRQRQVLERAVRELCPGETLRMPDDAATELLAHLRPGNDELIGSNPSPEWLEWLEQPLATRGVTSLPDVSAERVTEVLCRTVEQHGAEIWDPVRKVDVSSQFSRLAKIRSRSKRAVFGR